MTGHRENEASEHDEMSHLVVSHTTGNGTRAPRLLQEIWLAPRNAAVLFMLSYRRIVSPMYGQVCRYHPSCSRYALEVLRQQGFVLGTLYTAWRLLRCNPFSPGGIDDPPLRVRPKFSINARGFARPTIRKA